MARPLTVACLQTRPQSTFQHALDEALMRAEVAVSVGAELVLLPEYCGGLVTRGRAFAPPACVEGEHPVLLGLQEFAAAKHVWVVIGSVAVEAPEGRVFNRGFVIDNTGKIRARYDKLHLFDVDLEDNAYRESDSVSAGKRAVMCETPFGRMGFTICYDLRFPQLYRELSQAGAEMLLVPAAFTKKTGEAHWHVLNRARAIENGAFVMAPCAVGPVEGGGESYGDSLIVNPWGEGLVDAGKLPGVVHTTIDLDEVAQTRAQIPSWSDERTIKVSDGKRFDKTGEAVA